MIFSSLLFLYIFLPVVLLLIFVFGKRWHNGILLLASIIFYAWGGVSYTLLLLTSILINYGIGRGITRFRDSVKSKGMLVLGVVLNLLMLGIFKYANFITGNLDVLLQALGWKLIEMKTINLPIGISFFTFQAISYIADVYEKKTHAEKQIINVGLYISLFPQLIAGPIVRYRVIANQIKQRVLSWEKCAYGIERFVWGLAKKVLLANTFAVLADDIFALQPQNLDPVTAWTGMIFYTMQLYFDFSGYSDMAVGLGSILGFQIPENFNFPYISRSIREFWRRWHITLSQWFRDYVYIPLGGSKRTGMRTYLNLITVFVLVGFWHGAAWTYVCFGLMHGGFMLLERRGLERFLHNHWAPVAHIYTMLVFMLSLVLFRSQTFSDALHYIGTLFGFGGSEAFDFDYTYYFNPEMIILTVIGILACTPVFRKAHHQLIKRLGTGGPWMTRGYDLSCVVVTILIFFYCTMNLAMGTYNPFIYYQF